MAEKKLRIAFLGGRGLPATYGGYCTLFEEVATRLMQSGEFDITVYCRKSYFDTHPAEIDGIRLVYLPVWRNRYFESLLFTGLCVLHTVFRRFDAVLVVDNANAPLLLPLWLLRIPNALHTDGLGWKRRKWGRFASRYYRWTERVAGWFTTTLVTDARAMQDYYLQQYQSHSVFIPYGSEVGDAPAPHAAQNFGLTPGAYFLVVTRIEADNNTDVIVREYKRAAPDIPLVIVGAARYPTPYSDALHAEANDNVIFLGGIFDSAVLNGLYQQAFAYLHGHMVGGTNPALLRAMDAGRCCIAIDVAFNREVLGEQGLFFNTKAGSLATVLTELRRDPSAAFDRGQQLSLRAASQYNWEAVADGYARLFTAMAQREDVVECYLPEQATDLPS